jgi:hypothetical protein
MAETKVVNLEVKTNVEPLKKQLKEAQKEVEALAAKFGDTSAEAVNAAKKAALLKDAIGDAKALTESFNPDAKFNALSGSLSGVAGGFSAVQGAMGLVGVDCKNVEATLLKVQSAMAFSEGLNSVLAAKDAFKNLAAVIGQTAIGQKLLTAAQVVGATVMKALNFVMKQNPIFLIIAGITAAVTAFKYFTQSTDSAALAQEELNRKQEISIRLMKVQQEDTNKYISRLEKNSRDKIALAKAEGANSEEIYQLEKARLEDQIRYRKVLHDYNIKLTAEQYAQQKQAKFDLKILEAQHRTDLAKIEEEKTAKAKIENEKRIADKKEENEKKRALDEAAFNEKQSLRISQQAEDAKELADAIKFDEDKHKAEVEALQKSADARKEANEKIAADNKQRIAKEIADENALRQTKLQMVSSSLSILQDATSLFTTKNEKDARTQFKINKALSLSSAVVNTALAVTAALTAGGNPIKLATGMQFVEAGIAAASGAVSIAKISATQFNASGGSGGGGGSTPSGGGGGNNAQIQAPSFNIVGNNGLNQLSQLKQAPVQAYVVSGAMSTAQSLDRNRVRNATL